MLPCRFPVAEERSLDAHSLRPGRSPRRAELDFYSRESCCLHISNYRGYKYSHAQRERQLRRLSQYPRSPRRWRRRIRRLRIAVRLPFHGDFSRVAVADGYLSAVYNPIGAFGNWVYPDEPALGRA